MEEELPELEFSLDWSVLGPFQIGTRGTCEPFALRYSHLSAKYTSTNTPYQKPHGAPILWSLKAGFSHSTMTQMQLSEARLRTMP
jgi:hypothetical protein